MSQIFYPLLKKRIFLVLMVMIGVVFVVSSHGALAQESPMSFCEAKNAS